jgi:hypothetical protein
LQTTTWIHTSHYCHDTDDYMNTHKPLLSWYWWLHEYTQATIVMILMTTWIHTSHYCHDTDDYMNTHKPLLSWDWWLHEYTQATIVMILMTASFHRVNEEFENTIEVIRIGHQSMKNRQHNGPKKKYKRTNKIYKTYT